MLASSIFFIFASHCFKGVRFLFYCPQNSIARGRLENSTLQKQRRGRLARVMDYGIVLVDAQPSTHAIPQSLTRTSLITVYEVENCSCTSFPHPLRWGILIRELKQRRRQRQRLKTLRFNEQKQSLCTCVLNFGTSLCRPLLNEMTKNWRT